MPTVANKDTVFVQGASGRVGRALKRLWSGGPGGFAVLWQSRAQTPGWLQWSPLADPAPDLPPLRAAVVLSGVTPGRGGDMDDNRRLALAGLQAAAQAGARHVFLASSQAVYGIAATEIDEETPLRPSAPYGRAKAQMEEAAANWQAGPGQGVGVTCLRIGNVAGADMLGGAVALGKPVSLDRFPDGRGPERSYIGVRGFAAVLESLVAAIDGSVPLPFAMNVAAPHPVSMEALLRGWDAQWCWKDAPAKAIQSITLDVSRLQRFHSFQEQDSDPARMAAEWTRWGRQ